MAHRLSAPFFATVLCTAAALTAQQPVAPTQPNLLVIVPDDLGVDSVGCYGSPSAPPTPTLDALAAAGVRFTRAFVDPACTPSRAALLTGRHAFRSDATMALPPGAPGMAGDAVTIATALVDAGYQTAMIGKWHLGHRFGLQTPNVHGFQHFEGVLDSGVANPFAWPKVVNGVQAPCSTYVMTDEVNAAVQWIQGRTGPWALFLTPTLPHQPFHAPPAHLHTQNLAGLSPATTPVPFFRAMVQAMDSEIGRLLALLGPTVLANTNVVVIADNGTDGAVVQPPLSATRAKGSLSDGGTNVPLLVRGPAVTAPGSVATEMVAGVDLFPTLLAMCGVATYPSPALAAIAQPLDGQSVRTALAGASGYGRSLIYSEITGTPLGGGYTVRSELHRLVRYTQSMPQHQEFYNLVADPLQASDLLQNPLNWASTLYFVDLMTRLEAIRDDGWAEVFGSGCAGAAGVPALRTQSQPRIGTAFYTHVSATAPATVARFSFVGVSRSDYLGIPLPFALDWLGMPGCALQVSIDFVLWHNSDGYSPPLPVPMLAALYGTEFFVQAVAAEIGVNPAGLVLSRGLRCVMGR